MLPENEYSEIESRYYLNPQIALDESNNFIENLRSTQQQNTAQIARDTEQLGTAVSSNLGGLGGSTDYWTARYSTPQTASAVANLRATAQAQALNEVLANEQAIWKKRYQDAYRAAQRRAYNRSYGGGGTTDDTPKTTTGGVDENPTDDKTTITYSSEITGIPGKQNIVDAAGNMLVYDPVTGETVVVAPSATTQHGYAGEGGGGGGWGGR